MFSGKAQVLSCMQMAIGGGASPPQTGGSFAFGELASKLEDAPLPKREVYFARVSAAVSSAVNCGEGGTREAGAGS